MPKFISPHFNKVTAALAAAVLGAGVLPAIASAQALPAGEIQGTIASINDTFNISVSDNNGGIDNVELHQGTIINPTGLTLEPGMGVTIVGYADGSQFDANEIDTPYSYNGAAPSPVYYGPGFWYPGFAYGYGPSYSLGFGNGPILVRQPWAGRWYAHTPIPRTAYRAPIFVQPRAEMVRRPEPQMVYRPQAPAAPVARPAYVPQARPQYVPQARPQAPASRPAYVPQARPPAPIARSVYAPQARPQVPVAPAARPQFAPQARPQAPVARAPMPQTRGTMPAERQSEQGRDHRG